SHLVSGRLSVLLANHQLNLGSLRNYDVFCTILVSECVSANHDGLIPSGHQSRHVLAQNRLAEDSTSKDVSDG
ncbi:hypothetical protein PENTCL1PPCAC_15879, partial [Pristionchus entomophagus]